MHFPRIRTKNEYQQILDNYTKEKLTRCPKCGSVSKQLKGQNNLVVCSLSICKHRFSLFKNSIFFNVKLKKITILKIIDAWLQKINTKAISFFLKISPKAVRRVLKKVKESAVPKYYASLDVIGEKDVVVEIDESKFGKRKYHKGHAVEGIWVLGMVERTIKRKIILVAVDDRTKKTLTEKTTKFINSKSTLFTDCWKGYSDLSKHFNNHKTVNHSKQFVDPIDGTHTNTIEGCWYAVKAQVPVRNRTKNDISLYLLRFMIVRNEEDDPLIALLNLI